MGSEGRPGQIIFLNGTSNPGKPGIAGQLLLLPDPPHFRMPVDAINGMRATRKIRELGGAELRAVLTRTRAGFHRAVAGMAADRLRSLPDFSLPADEAAVITALTEAWERAAAERVEIACAGGRGRTGTA